MKRAVICCLVALVAFGCTSPRPTTRPSVQTITSQPWTPAESREHRLAMQDLGTLPNAGLTLPAVSPDGKWIASIASSEGSELRSLLTGRDTQGCSLVLAPVGGGAGKPICPGGVTWMIWSADSRTLAFIAYSQQGRCEMGIIDVAADRRRRLAVGLANMAMPALSPSGGKVAVVDCAALPTFSRLYTVELATGKSQPGPSPQSGHRHLWPQWQNEETLVYLDWEADGAAFVRWNSASGQIQKVHQLVVAPASLDDAMAMMLPVSRPLSGGRLAYYDPTADRIVLVNLATGRARRLPAQTRCGCWMGQAFAATTDKYLYVCEPALDGDDRVLRGAYLPLWGDGHQGRLILCQRGSDDSHFGLVDLRIQERK